MELRSNPKFELPKVSAIIVDEYQDLNRCDLNTIQILSERTGAEVYAAGDDDQSIYSFRHAVPAGIRSFAEEYAGAERLLLSECLRCGQDVLDLANWLIQQEQNREPKTLRSVTPWNATVHLLRFPNQVAEAAAIARMVQAEIAAGTQPEEILILAKSDANNRIANAVQAALGEADIALYLPRGARAKSDEVNRLLAYMTLAKSLDDDNRIDDLALRSLLELEDNGLGADRLWAVTQLALERRVRFSAAITLISDQPDEFRRARLNDVVVERERISANAAAMVQGDDETFLGWLSRVAEMLALDAESRRLLDNVANQIERELADEAIEASGMATGHEQLDQPPVAEPPSRDFLAELLAAMTNLGETLPAKVPDHVTFTTMHGAKGLSADIVFVLQVEDEIIPGEAAGLELDESRRLLYVSLTRARKKLVIGACQRRTGPQRFVGSKERIHRTLSSFVRDYGLVAATLPEYLKGISNQGM
jgi:DNA helicase-2/ATP-dependent DNA helicase PcrA